MNDLIKALTIFAKYQPETRWPTHCSHDQMTIVGVGLDDVPEAERVELEALGFIWSDYAWISFRFGSA